MIVKFLFFSLCYFLGRSLISDKFGNRKQLNVVKWVMLGIYLTIVIGLQFADVMAHMKQICGNVQTDKAIMYTFLPNLLIFGLLIMLLFAFPGWKAPFSNTIGYALSLGLGVKKNFNDLLNSNMGNSLLQKITQDKSMIINEITPGNFDLFLSEMSKNGLLAVTYEDLGKLEERANKGDKLNERESTYLDAFKGLYKAVVSKDLIAECLWYLLGGSLVITLTKNTVAEMECEKNKQEMIDEYNESGGRSLMKSLKD